MSTSESKKIDAIMDVYKNVSRHDSNKWMRWASKPKPLSLKQANEIFVGVMLDQGQIAEIAWEKAQHFVKNNFLGKHGFRWDEVLRTPQLKINRICTKGYDGKSYAVHFTTNKFPVWIKSAAKRMVYKYNGDPRGIWSVKPEEVQLIYDRLREFDGIGDALAKFGQFTPVRSHGIAGGKKMQSKMSVKPDILVRRVLFRMGVTSSERIKTTIDQVAALQLKRPVDFDAASWIVGREYCRKRGLSNQLCN